jgi:hypothetical protein
VWEFFFGADKALCSFRDLASVGIIRGLLLEVWVKRSGVVKTKIVIRLIPSHSGIFGPGQSLKWAFQRHGTICESAMQLSCSRLAVTNFRTISVDLILTYYLVVVIQPL